LDDLVGFVVDRWLSPWNFGGGSSGFSAGSVRCPGLFELGNLEFVASDRRTMSCTAALSDGTPSFFKKLHIWVPEFSYSINFENFGIILWDRFVVWELNCRICNISPELKVKLLPSN
jgi:hypothetical protein